LHWHHLLTVTFLLTHHDPQHSDERLDEIFEESNAEARPSFFYELAKEGMEIQLA
jgi:hypothetical protein